MRILGTILSCIVAVLPIVWLENYTVTNSIWWTVVLAWAFGRLFGYFEGLKAKEKENEK